MAHSILQVQVAPRARHTAWAGEDGETVRLRIAAPPTDGRANDELVEWLAETLGLPRSAVRVVSGQASRRKRVRIEGLDGLAVRARLRASADGDRLGRPPPGR